MKITKITRVTLDHYIPMYDLQINNNHNFVLANGCVVHNSKDTCDACCGVAKSILDNLDIFKELSQKYVMEHTTKLYQDLYHKDQRVENLENQIKSLFNQ